MQGSPGIIFLAAVRLCAQLAQTYGVMNVELPNAMDGDHARA